MDMRPAERANHPILNPDRFGTHPKAKAALGDLIEQMRHKSDTMELDEVAPLADDDGEGEWEEVRAVGRAKCKGKSKGKGKPKAPASKSTEPQGGKKSQNGTWGHKDPENFPYNCHSCGEKGPHNDTQQKVEGKRHWQKGRLLCDDEAMEERTSPRTLRM